MIDKYNLRFEKKDLVEDIEWSALLLLYLNTIDVFESPFYIYRQGSSSKSHSLNLKDIKYMLKNQLMVHK